MTNEQKIEWDGDMQERVFGAAPKDDYNFKTRTFPKYSTDASAARTLVETINRSGRYHVRVSAPQVDEYTVEITGPDGQDRLSSCRGPVEAAVICEAIMTADVKL